MPEKLDGPTETRCPRCGETSRGHFCSGCGAVLRDVACAGCDRPLTAGDRFCSNCGTPVGAADSAASGAERQLSGSAMTKFVVATAILMLVAYVAGQALGRRADRGAADATQAGTAPPPSM